MGVKKGEEVEVCSDEEGFKGAWYRATVIRKWGSEYVIEFKDLVTDDQKSKVREQVGADQIRPVPPSMKRQYFIPREIVDAHDRDGWWIGTIENVMDDNNYLVHFSHSGEKLEYNVSQLRLHLDWVDGQWVQTSQPSENPNSISQKPNRGNTRPNKFKREAIFCGLSADGKADSLKNAENQPNETLGKRRKTTKDKQDDALTGKGTMNTAVKDVEGAKNVTPYKAEEEKNHSSALNANITKATEVPFPEPRLKEAQNILPYSGVKEETQRPLDSYFTPEKKIAMNSFFLVDNEKTNGYPGTTSETGAKATLKEMELHAYNSVLKALYLQGTHSLKIEVLLADLREVLHISNVESASELRRITYAQNN